MSCTDIDECERNDPPLCSQTCTNSIGSFVCSCLEGYIQNDTFCEAAGDPARLVFSNGFDLREISLVGKEYRMIVKRKNTVALDFDIQSGNIFFTDLPNGFICQQPINSQNISDVSCEGEVDDDMIIDGIGYDWIHKNMYWSDTGLDKISVMSLASDMVYIKALITDALDEPRAVAVDPRDDQRWLYWTDWGNDAKIEKSGLDGSHRITLIDQQETDIVWPNGLTLGKSMLKTLMCKKGIKAV